MVFNLETLKLKYFSLKRMLLARQQGVNGLREKRVNANGDWTRDKACEEISSHLNAQIPLLPSTAHH